MTTERMTTEFQQDPDGAERSRRATGGPVDGLPDDSGFTGDDPAEAVRKALMAETEYTMQTFEESDVLDSIREVVQEGFQDAISGLTESVQKALDLKMEAIQKSFDERLEAIQKAYEGHAEEIQKANTMLDEISRGPAAANGRTGSGGAAAVQPPAGTETMNLDGGDPDPAAGTASKWATIQKANDLQLQGHGGISLTTHEYGMAQKGYLPTDSRMAELEREIAQVAA